MKYMLKKIAEQKYLFFASPAMGMLPSFLSQDILWMLRFTMGLLFKPRQHFGCTGSEPILELAQISNPFYI
jgi:hypothetical protein